MAAPQAQFILVTAVGVVIYNGDGIGWDLNLINLIDLILILSKFTEPLGNVAVIISRQRWPSGFWGGCRFVHVLTFLTWLRLRMASPYPHLRRQILAQLIEKHRLSLRIQDHALPLQKSYAVSRSCLALVMTSFRTCLICLWHSHLKAQTSVDTRTLPILRILS